MRYGIIALFLLLGGGQAWGASVELRAYDDNPAGARLFTIRIIGKIDTGDVDKIRKAYRQAHKRGLTVIALELGSWGGDADTGMAIAEYVHANRRVRVLISDKCSSSCSYAALVALGNGRMTVMSSAVLGVHQVYDNGTLDPDRAWTQRAAKQLRRWGAPETPLDSMVDTLPSSMTYYHADDLVGMGAVQIDQGWSWLPW